MEELVKEIEKAVERAEERRDKTHQRAKVSYGVNQSHLHHADGVVAGLQIALDILKKVANGTA
jgi:hypothetical protein